MVLSALFLAGISLASPVKVAVIDTGLDVTDARFARHICKDGNKDFTNTGLADHAGHGTHIAGLIKRYATDANYCLMIVKFYDPDIPERGSLNRMIKSIRYAIHHGAKIINISGGGGTYDHEERELIKRHPDVLFIVAAGNAGKDLDESGYVFYPADYELPNIVPVGSLSLDGHSRYPSSNFGSIVKAWEIGEKAESDAIGLGTVTMTGTSMATAIHTGRVINEVTADLY